MHWEDHTGRPVCKARQGRDDSTKNSATWRYSLLDRCQPCGRWLDQHPGVLAGAFLKDQAR